MGKLVSLKCAVPAGMWYTREQYSALRLTGLFADYKKSLNEIRELEAIFKYICQSRCKF